jgi:hypothetical protein
VEEETRGGAVGVEKGDPELAAKLSGGPARPGLLLSEGKVAEAAGGERDKDGGKSLG